MPLKWNPKRWKRVIRFAAVFLVSYLTDIYLSLQLQNIFSLSACTHSRLLCTTHAPSNSVRIPRRHQAITFLAAPFTKLWTAHHLSHLLSITTTKTQTRSSSWNITRKQRSMLIDAKYTSCFVWSKTLQYGNLIDSSLTYLTSWSLLLMPVR